MSNSDNLKYFKVQVTRDTTESALLPIVAADKEIAASEAIHSEVVFEFADRFEADDMGNGEVYLPDPDGIVEISKDEYASLLNGPWEDVEKKLYMSVAATAEEYSECPRYAVTTVNKQFLERLVQMKNICIDNSLEEVRAFDSPLWEKEEDFRLEGFRLIVTPKFFYFTAYPSLQDYDIETRLIEIDDLLESVAYEGDLYYADDVEQLKQLLKKPDCQ